jgi:hemoglobin-like flavoprotein
MTSRFKQLVQKSFEELRPQAEATSSLFYGHLFELNPRLEKLFINRLRSEGLSLMQTIAIAVRGLDRFDEIAPLLNKLGARYAGYGVQESDYETVCTAWLWAIERGLGDLFTAEVRAAWIAVNELMTGAMKTGAREALIVTAAPRDESAAFTRDNRNGWRKYLAPAANRNLKASETGIQALSNYETLTGRFATTMGAMAMLIGLLFFTGSAASAKTITVTGTGDTIAVDGVVTLREAITAANTNAPCGDAPAGDPGLDVINFNIAGGGVQTISPTSALPAITEPITINGYTQPGASANTLAVGSNAVLLIELSGAAANSMAGLTIDAGNSTIRGLVINRFNNRGIFLETNGSNTIAGNYIGTNAAGTVSFASPNNGLGIYIATPNNTIGGLTPADRNVISGNGNANGGAGIVADTANATGNRVIGNYIGTNASGMAAIPNYNSGLFLISGSSNSIVGGTTFDERNVISGNSNGVAINGSSSNQIIGNYIGARADGTTGVANNSDIGVNLTNSSNNTIGGPSAGSGNLIAFNTGAGVSFFSGINNAILGNSIHSNFQLGIDLFSGAFGVTPNDDNVGDVDTGPNNLQNFPVITSAVSNGGTTTIKGTLDSAFSTQFRLEFFSNTAADSSGFGEGQTFLGFVNSVTDASGKASFTFNVPTANVVGNFFSATATDPNGNTSEFAASASGVANSPGTLQLSTNSQLKFENSGSFTINVTRTNGSTGTVTVHYATADGTAKAPSDYTGTSGTLTFNDGETSKPITVPIIDDNTPEGMESFTLTLSNPTGGAVLGSTTSANLFIQDNEDPTLSISDVSQAEGNSGTTAFTFTVTSSNAITNDVSVSYATGNGTATAGSDYQTTSGSLTILAGQTSKTITVLVNGDTTNEPDETFFVNLSNASSATITKSQGVGTIVNDDGVAPPSLQFSSANYSVQEDLQALTVTVTRSGDTSGAASVSYATVDGTATQKGDFELAVGTLNFAPGDTSKTFQVLINEDMYVEGNETFGLALTNASGASIGQQGTATVTINDDVPESLTNPIDDPQSFVYMQYHDFLGREPDATGLQNWVSTLAGCPNGGFGEFDNPNCDRVHVSAGFYLSEEFQGRGYWAYRFYQTSLGRAPLYKEFIPDMLKVGGSQSPQQEVVNKQAFTDEWVNRPEFKAKYDALVNPVDYVNALMITTGVNLPNHDALINALQNNQMTRAQVLREIVESKEVDDKFFVQAFVSMQYFGYLRRDPDTTGYNNWVTTLTNDPGNYRHMIFGFIYSTEYRQRFGF